MNNININNNRKLKDLLNMDRTFSDILTAIENNNNINENINKFYTYLFGKVNNQDLISHGRLYQDNLNEIILNNNNNSELEAINKILKID